MFHDPSSPRLHIDGISTTADGSVIVCLAGELDNQETDRLQAGITQLALRHARAPIQIDATRLTFVDSAGIRALLTCHRFVEQAGSRMSMPWVHPNIFQVLQITGLLETLGVMEQIADLPGQSADAEAGFPPAVHGERASD